MILIVLRMKAKNKLLGYVEPQSFSDIENYPDKSKWLKTIKDELDSMEKNTVWELVPRPQNKKLLKSRWVFRIKEDSNGKSVRYKARLVAKWFLQKAGVDYDETWLSYPLFIYY